jgi:hypothetical protein
VKGLAGLLLVGGAIVLGYLYFTGQLSGYGSGTPDLGGAADATGQASTAAVGGIQAFWSWLIGEPWGITALVSAGAATLGVMTWRRIGGWGRGVVVFLGAVALTIVVMRLR